MELLTEKESIARVLGQYSLRITAVRIAVFDILQRSDFALSHSEIMRLLPEHVDRVTLFRTLNSFIEKNLIHKILDDNGIARYALCDWEKCSVSGHRDQHVHFKCKICQRIFCVHLENYQYPEMPGAFRVVDWKISAEGICPSCGVRSGKE